MTDHHFDIQKVSKLENKGRIEELRPYELLKNVANLVEGMTCVDLGCGTGVFSLPMANLVGSEGRVYAVDDSDVMLDQVRKKNPPPNLILVKSDVAETGLKSGIADFCLLAFILHEVKYPDRPIEEASRLLKPGGKILAVEWKAELDAKGPPKSIRLSKQKIKDLFNRFNLTDFHYQNWSQNHYVATGTLPLS